MKTFGIICLIVVGLVALMVGAYTCSWVGQVANVVSKEVAPANLLRKYEWFKDQLAALDSMRARIDTAKQNMVVMEQAFTGVEVKEWPDQDRRQYFQWRRGY